MRKCKIAINSSYHAVFKHFYTLELCGIRNYIEGRSYLTVSLDEEQELVNKYAGTGEIDRDKKGKWKHTETVIHSDIIGFDVDNRTGSKVETPTFKIHYSKSGTHIVPKRE